MAKPEKKIPDAAAAEGVVKPKSKKMVFIGIGVFVLLVAAGAGWYFLKGSGGDSGHAEAPKPKQELAPRFVKLETFTINLSHGEGEEERVLQTVINLEVHSAELEEKAKMYMPKIYNNVLILLSRKRPAEISTPDGKQQLAREIKAEVDYVLGLRAAPAPILAPIAAASGAAPEAPHAAPVPAEAPRAAHGGESEAGITDVLFTVFIIQ